MLGFHWWHSKLPPMEPLGCISMQMFSALVNDRAEITRTPGFYQISFEKKNIIIIHLPSVSAGALLGFLASTATFKSYWVEYH